MKIRHPGIIEKVTSDLDIVFGNYFYKGMCGLISKIFTRFEIPVERGHFTTTLLEQADFNNEGINTEQFRYNFDGL